MKKIIIVGVVMILVILISGCTPGCDFSILTQDESIVNTLEYRENNHTKSECFEYCRSLSFCGDTDWKQSQWNDKECLEICE